MKPDLDLLSILRLRTIFENRDAIYIEKGALKVRVSNIRASKLRRILWAEIEEVPTPGLGEIVRFVQSCPTFSQTNWQDVFPACETGSAVSAPAR